MALSGSSGFPRHSGKRMDERAATPIFRPEGPDALPPRLEASTPQLPRQSGGEAGATTSHRPPHDPPVERRATGPDQPLPLRPRTRPDVHPLAAVLRQIDRWRELASDHAWAEASLLLVSQRVREIQPTARIPSPSKAGLLRGADHRQSRTPTSAPSKQIKEDEVRSAVDLLRMCDRIRIAVIDFLEMESDQRRNDQLGAGSLAEFACALLVVELALRSHIVIPPFTRFQTVFPKPRPRAGARRRGKPKAKRIMSDVPL